MQSKRIFISLHILCLISSSLYGMHTTIKKLLHSSTNEDKKHIRPLLKVIQKKHCSYKTRYKKQLKLIKAIPIHRPLATDLLDRSLDALMMDNNFSILNQHAAVIATALRMHAYIPNMHETIQTALSQLNSAKTAKGPFYEIARTVNIAKTQPHARGGIEEIIALNVIKKAPHKKIQRQFDIISNTCWYECKNYTTWPMKKYAIQKLRKQFLDQKTIADEYNASHKKEATIQFEVRSKKAIPSAWQSWFNQQGIACVVTG